MKVNEIINKLEQELGLPFYYISRDENIKKCVTYNYLKEPLVSDLKKEGSLYEFYFILILDTKINSTIDKFEEILIDNLFSDVKVNTSAFTNDGLIQISITGTKILN